MALIPINPRLSPQIRANFDTIEANFAAIETKLSAMEEMINELAEQKSKTKVTKDEKSEDHHE